jgi:hypothetical protein
MDAKTLMIRNWGSKVNLFASASLSETGKAADKYSLVFHKYGDHAFLWGMRIAGSRII